MSSAFTNAVQAGSGLVVRGFDLAERKKLSDASYALRDQIDSASAGAVPAGGPSVRAPDVPQEASAPMPQGVGLGAGGRPNMQRQLAGLAVLHGRTDEASRLVQADDARQMDEVAASFYQRASKLTPDQIEELAHLPNITGMNLISLGTQKSKDGTSYQWAETDEKGRITGVHAVSQPLMTQFASAGAMLNSSDPAISAYGRKLMLSTAELMRGQMKDYNTEQRAIQAGNNDAAGKVSLSGHNYDTLQERIRGNKVMEQARWAEVNSAREYNKFRMNREAHELLNGQTGFAYIPGQGLVSAQVGTGFNKNTGERETRFESLEDGTPISNANFIPARAVQAIQTQAETAAKEMAGSPMRDNKGRAIIVNGKPAVYDLDTAYREALNRSLEVYGRGAAPSSGAGGVDPAIAARARNSLLPSTAAPSPAAPSSSGRPPAGGVPSHWGLRERVHQQFDSRGPYSGGIAPQRGTGKAVFDGVVYDSIEAAQAARNAKLAEQNR